MADSRTMTETSVTLFLSVKSRYIKKVIVFVFVTTLSGQHVEFPILFALKYVVLFIPSEEMGN